jgi:chromosome segregation ATPase
VKQLTPGLRELARILGRQVGRLRLILERRKLARLETALGLLGWQQADYDPGTQEQVSRLTDCEREQVRLTNESAALGLEIQRLEEQRGIAQREIAEAEASALEREQPSAADADALVAQLAALRKDRKAMQSRLPVMDRELSAAEQQYRALIAAGTPSAHMQNQLLNWRKVILAIPKERAEWATQLAQASSQLTAMETLLAALREARGRFEKRDEELVREIATCQRAKHKVEKEIDHLEQAKTDPYREIGRALADHDIAPLNQPEALGAVLGQRQRITLREAAIAASLAESTRENRRTMWKPWLLAGGMIGLGLAALLAIAGQ